MAAADITNFIDRHQDPSRSILLELVNFFNEHRGCGVDHKTIYLSFTLSGATVAAAYPHSDRVEVALALADDASDPRLEDASHLTWRSMPVMTSLWNPSDIEAVSGLLEEAIERVKSGSHDVSLPDERFIRSKQGRRLRRT